ncbi:MAG TPA: hypothetical protein DIC56_07435 [Rhizobium sp.]|nr:hypothetical protein [Rhizobium sp.]
MKTVVILWRHHRLLLMAFVVATALTLFFAARFTFFVLYWSDPAHRDQPLQGWMTIGYIAHSYDVPREALANALGLVPPEKGKRPTLDALARDKGMTAAEFQAEVEAAIERLRKGGTDK